MHYSVLLNENEQQSTPALIVTVKLLKKKKKIKIISKMGLP